ncbi:MAG: phosphohistidine phosphatase [Solirubrobacterales bacterium]|jgi:phosphohistidine phosphatase|nr:phosphohistidine phosphatase [Solirubrobacterales bacterium]
MPRQLWFLRHGDAEPHGTRPDAERRLTPRGEEQSVLAGRALAALECSFAHVFASPRVRARDTARLACPPLGVEPVEHDPLARGFSRGDALELLLAVGPDEALLVVGHEPDFSQVVHDLTGARVDFKKGGVVAVRMEGTVGGELVVALRPRELARIAGA